MAEAARRLTLGADADFAPWSTVCDLAAVTAPDDWVLVGGLMVEAHVRAAGVTRSRATSDLDMIVDVAGGATVQQLYGELLSIGFTLQQPERRGAPAYRFHRGADIVDLMVARGVTPAQRLAGAPALAVEGAAHVLQHSERWTVTADRGSATIRVPELYAAIVAKCAAYTVDQRDRGRHLEDIAALLVVASPDDVEAFENIGQKERKRMRPAFAALADRTSSAWLDIDAAAANRAQQTREVVARVARL